MTQEDFVQRIHHTLRRGVKFNSPKVGSSEVINLTEKHIAYQKGDTIYRLSFEGMFRTYQHFKGMKISTTQLKLFDPATFSPTTGPTGSDYNCVFFFMVLRILGLAGAIDGSGVSSAPFYCRILAPQTEAAL